MSSFHSAGERSELQGGRPANAGYNSGNHVQANGWREEAAVAGNTSQYQYYNAQYDPHTPMMGGHYPAIRPRSNSVMMGENSVPLSTISPGAIWPTDAQLNASYGYGMRRENGTITRLYPADDLPPPHSVAPYQGSEGLIIVPTPRQVSPNRRMGAEVMIPGEVSVLQGTQMVLSLFTRSRSSNSCQQFVHIITSKATRMILHRCGLIRLLHTQVRLILFRLQFVAERRYTATNGSTRVFVHSHRWVASTSMKCQWTRPRRCLLVLIMVCQIGIVGLTQSISTRSQPPHQPWSRAHLVLLAPKVLGVIVTKVDLRLPLREISLRLAVSLEMAALDPLAQLLHPPILKLRPRITHTPASRSRSIKAKKKRTKTLSPGKVVAAKSANLFAL